MRNWILKIILTKFAGPIVDAIIAILERLAIMTETSIDDALVQQFKNYRDVIVKFLISQLDDVIKSQKKP